MYWKVSISVDWLIGGLVLRVQICLAMSGGFVLGMSEDSWRMLFKHSYAEIWWPLGSFMNYVDK